MTIRAKIYRPSKNPMQSGRAKTQEWMLEYDPVSPHAPEHLMGWTASDDTLAQVRLSFESQEAAEAYAQARNIPYDVIEKTPRVIVPRSYLDNFKYRAPAPKEDAGK